MNKLEELQRIIYEHYNSEELVEYYKRKILQIKKNWKVLRKILLQL